MSASTSSLKPFECTSDKGCDSQAIHTPERTSDKGCDSQASTAPAHHQCTTKRATMYKPTNVHMHKVERREWDDGGESGDRTHGDSTEQDRSTAWIYLSDKHL